VETLFKLAGTISDAEIAEVKAEDLPEYVELSGKIAEMEAGMANG